MTEERQTTTRDLAEATDRASRTDDSEPNGADRGTDDLDDTLARLREHGAQLVDEVVQYEDVYRLCYVRGPEGILIGLAEQIG